MDNKDKKATDEKETKKVKVRPIKKSPNDDFKRKYFELYDDIKISDRQDW